MNTKELVDLALEYGFDYAGPLNVSGLQALQDVRDACAKNTCGQYGRTWGCPPAFGDLDESRKILQKYKSGIIVQSVQELEDSFDFEGMGAAMSGFKETVLRFDELVRPLLGPCLFLTNEGCGRCRACTWPDAPCRFPESLHHSLEGYGFNVSSLAEQAGLHYTAGPDTVTFFGALLF